MKPASHQRSQSSQWPALGLLLGVALFLVGCAATPTATPTAAPAATPTAAPVQRLRITNQGAVAITALTVLFPDVRLDFGDVAPGATTAYQDVPSGVFAYAAYDFEIDGQVKRQPVIDWMGETPLAGIDFTYQLYFDPSRWDRNDAIQLSRVTTDQ